MNRLLLLVVIFSVSSPMAGKIDSLWQTVSESEFEYRVALKDTVAVVEERYIDEEGNCGENIWQYRYSIRCDTVLFFTAKDTIVFIPKIVEPFLQKYELHAMGVQKEINSETDTWVTLDYLFYYPVQGKYEKEFTKKWSALNCSE